MVCLGSIYAFQSSPSFLNTLPLAYKSCPLPNVMGGVYVINTYCIEASPGQYTVCPKHMHTFSLKDICLTSSALRRKCSAEIALCSFHHKY